MKKQLTILALLVTFIANASGTTVTDQNSEPFQETFSDTIADTIVDIGITVISQDDSLVYSYTYTPTDGKWRVKDEIRSLFRELKNLDWPFFMSGPAPNLLPIVGLTIAPIFIFPFIIAGIIALYILGKRSKEKEREIKKGKTDNTFNSKQEYHNNKKSNSFTKVNQFNEKTNKALILIICGGILLLLSLFVRQSWLARIGAIILIIIGIVDYITGMSSRK